MCKTTKIDLESQNQCETNCAYCYPEISTDTDGNPSCNDMPTKDSNKQSSVPYFLCEFDENGDPHKCYNRYKTSSGVTDDASRCIEIYPTTNASLVPLHNQFIMTGLADWIIRFDIFMKFGKYWMTRNIVNEYYQDINVWTINQILAEVGTTYENIKDNGIVIAANGIFECTLFSSHCKASWRFARFVTNIRSSHNPFLIIFKT